MKNIFAFLLFNLFTFISFAQDVNPDALARIAKIEVQAVSNGKAIVKLWIASTDVESLDYIKMQLSGKIIPRMTVLTTLKQSSSIVSASGEQVILMESEITINTPKENGHDIIRYVFKKSGPTNFRNLKPGSITVFPPVDK